MLKYDILVKVTEVLKMDVPMFGSHYRQSRVTAE